MPKLLEFSELRERGILLTRRQVDRIESQGLFPRRVKVSGQRVGWLTAEIDDYVDLRIARRATSSREIAA